MRIFLLLLFCALGARAQAFRVEPRSFVKQGHFFTSLGGTWLERGDYWLNPGLSLSAAYYPTESGGAEVRVLWFFSSLSESAQQVNAATGFVPDARKPELLALAGWRQSLTYGKVALAGGAVHFDLQGALHGGALARELLEHRGAAQAALFEDLVRLCDCETLAPLETPDPLRQLVRIEAARGARLGAKGGASETLWRDLLRKDFFRRDPRNPPLENALAWPDEEELWTGEIRVVEAPRWRCDQPAPPPAAQDDTGLAGALRTAGYREAASRFAYHRASRLLARGEKTAAAQQARGIDPAALGELRHLAALL